jgi:hypothetical protein
LNSSRDGIEELRAAGVPVCCSTDSGVYVTAVAQTDIVMTQSSEYFCIVSLPSSSCRKRKGVKNLRGGLGVSIGRNLKRKEITSPLNDGDLGP